MLTDIWEPLNNLESAAREDILRSLHAHRIVELADLRDLPARTDDVAAIVASIWLLARAASRHDTTTTAALIAYTQHRVAEARAETARTLAVRPTARAIRPLSHVLATDNDVEVRVACAYALGRMGYSEAGPALVAALQSSENHIRVRGMAAESIGLLPQVSEEAISVLIRSLEDPAAEVAFWAAGALGALKVKRAAAPLRALLERTEIVLDISSLADEARQALAQVERSRSR